jgi:7-carboxy-7-deazaguanine synthase
MSASGKLPAARIVEVVSSIQGEGARLGERQVFVRFGGCNLRCDYCDEPDASDLESGEVWDPPSLESAISALLGAEAGLRHRSVCWTGGEPLLQWEFLDAMADWVRRNGLENFLETNGVLSKALEKVVGRMDTVSVDVKLPSAVGVELWDEHARFLRLVPPGSFVKVILTEASTAQEWDRVLQVMEEAAPKLPLVLQPATPVPSTRRQGETVRPIPPVRALEFLLKAKQRLGDVRLVPQWHPVWKMR